MFLRTGAVLEISLKNVIFDKPKKLFHVPDLLLRDGERIFIHGPSGIGKSTFLHLLAGLILPDSGNVYWGNQVFSDKTDAQRTVFRRQHFGLIFQKLNLLNHLTIEENMILGSTRAPRPGQLLEILKDLEIFEEPNKKVAHLSLGQQQRVAVGRVLFQNHPVILADEPTSSLDMENAQRIMELLTKKCHKALLVVVSHDDRIRSFFNRSIDFRDYAAL